MKSAKIVSVVMFIVGVSFGIFFILKGLTPKNLEIREPMITTGAILIVIATLFSGFLWFLGNRPIGKDEKNKKV